MTSSTTSQRVHIWYGFFLVAVLAALGVSVYRYRTLTELNQIDRELQARVDVLIGSIRTERQEKGSSSAGALTAEQSKLFEQSGDDYYYVSWLFNRQELTRSRNAPANVPAPQKENVTGLHGLRDRDEFREAYLFTPPGDCLMAGRSMAPVYARWRHLASLLGWAETGLLVVAVAGGFLIFTRGFRAMVLRELKI